MTGKHPLLSLSTARGILRRAIDKAEDFGARATYVTVDGAGAIVTASRMDGAGAISFAVSRAKAFGAVAHRTTSAFLTDLYLSSAPIQFQAMQQVSPKLFFPGPGAHLIEGEGRVIGAITTGIGVPPFVKLPGVDPSKLIVDGKAANAEDICAAYALQRPYAPQHGDDHEAWIKAYGKPPEGRGTGLDEAPKAAKQAELDAAIVLSDAAMAEAERRNVLAAIAVVDRNGDVIQVDRMDNAAPVTPDLALSLAITAVNFGGSSANAAKYPSFDSLANVTPYKFLPVAGGLAIVKDGLIEGAIGVGGVDPEVCEAIARAAISKI